MAQPVKAIGLEFKINGTTVAEVMDFEGPGIVNEPIQTTSHSTTGGYHQFILGPKTLEDIKFDINWVPSETTHGTTGNGLVALANSGDSFTWACVWPEDENGDHATWTGTGLLLSFTPKAAIEDQLMAEIVVKPTGAPSFS